MIEHEQQLLALVAMYPEQVLECGTLNAGHFSNQAYGKIFEVANKMFDDKKPVSLSGIGAEINETWASSALVELSGVSVAGSAKGLSEAIIDAKIGESAICAFDALQHRLKTGRKQRDTIGELIETLAKIADEKTNERLTTMDLVMDSLMEKVRNPVEESAKLKTGITTLDDWLGGFQNSMLYIVSGVPSMGKSLFMANLICNIALSGKHVHVGSLEDTSIQMAGRIISRLSGVDSEPIVKGDRLSWEEIQTIERVVEKTRDAMSNIHIDDSTGQGVGSIRRTCTKLKSKDQLDISFIDHMGEMTKIGKDKYTAATANAEGLSAIAKDLCIPVVSGCQVARSAVTQSAHGKDAKDHRNYIPRSHHLRDSGRIEEIARCIMFVHRPVKWNRELDASDFWVNIDKQTHGRTGIVEMKTRLDTMAVVSPEEYHSGVSNGY
jgi:replicative DNA helicase